MFNECMRPAATNASFIIMMVAAFQGLHNKRGCVSMTFDRATSDCDDDDRNAMTVFHIHMIYSFYSNAMERNFILISYFYIIVFLFCCRRRRHYATLLALSKVHQNPLIIKRKK